MIGLVHPYLIIGAIVTAISMYFYGHHVGWDERDKEMQIEIAKKNEEAREHRGERPGLPPGVRPGQGQFVGAGQGAGGASRSAISAMARIQ